MDDCDYEYLSQWKWYTSGSRYAARKPDSGIIYYMHREVVQLIGLLLGAHTDHINGNGFDNRRQNLRPASSPQNLINRGPQVNNTSGFKGVCFDRSRDKWKAQLKKDQKMVFQARFDDKVEAAKAYNKAAKKHFGEFAWLNPIPEG